MDSNVVEQINATFQIPHEWRRFDIEVLWANIGTATGDVKWQLGHTRRTPGDALAEGTIFPPAVTAPAPAKNVEAKTVLARNVMADDTLDSGEAVWLARLSRQATDPADTLEATDAAVLGLLLRRTM